MNTSRAEDIAAALLKCWDNHPRMLPHVGDDGTSVSIEVPSLELLITINEDEIGIDCDVIGNFTIHIKPHYSDIHCALAILRAIKVI